MFSGSKMLEGDGRILVTAVGRNSQQGVIAGLVQGGEEDDAMRQVRARVVASFKGFITDTWVYICLPDWYLLRRICCKSFVFRVAGHDA